MIEHPEAPGMDALFPELDAALPPGKPGRVEALLMLAVQAATEAGTLVKEDWGLLGGALVGARGLDMAERGGKGSGPYAIAALLTPYREVCQALRLPAEVGPAEGPRPPAGTGGETPSWLGHEFGTPAQP